MPFATRWLPKRRMAIRNDILRIRKSPRVGLINKCALFTSNAVARHNDCSFETQGCANCDSMTFGTLL